MIFEKNVLNLIHNSSVVAIVTHVRPDADCLGSASALKGALLQLGKKADIFCDGEISENYLVLPYIDKINQPEFSDYDTIIAVDCGDINRTGKYADLFKTHENTLLIDHHMPEDWRKDIFTKYTVKENVSSTAEILFHLFKELGVEFNPNNCIGLYAGILTDTGGFLHSNTSPETHVVVGEILKHVPNMIQLNYVLIQKRTVGQLNVFKTALNNLRYICGGKVAITYLTERDFKQNHILNSENYGIVDMCVNIDTVDIGILISEKSPNLYACSLRGKDKDVSLIAKHFGGGGHRLASGCNIFGSYRAVIGKLEKVINDNYDRLS